MPSLQIGKVKIPYDLRRSAAACERRITVTPNHVEVVALASDSDDEIEGFLNRKRQWLFNTVREVEQAAAARHSVPRFMTGSKIPFRGRKMPLTVRRTDAECAQVAYRNGFVVDLPHWTGEDPDRLVASELKHWFKRRARRDVNEIAKSFGNRFDLVPPSIRVADLTNGWGACGLAGNIVINWHLIFAPRKVLEYVVVHELAHLRHRSHGPEFWAFLACIYPSYDKAKSWLNQHEVTVSERFLEIV